jgi:hypothetical protein
MRAALRVSLFLLAVFAGGVGVAETLKVVLHDRSDVAVRAMVDQAFDAASRIPLASDALQAALRPKRGDRQAMSDGALPAVSMMTVEKRFEAAQSILVRLPIIDVAQR